MRPGTRGSTLLSATGLRCSDDCYLPDRLANMVGFAEQHELTMLADNFYFYDGDAERVVRIAVNPSLIGERLDLDAVTFVSHCCGNNPNVADFGLLSQLFVDASSLSPEFVMTRQSATVRTSCFTSRRCGLAPLSLFCQKPVISTPSASARSVKNDLM